MYVLKRFGEESLHSCEVMLKDIEDSKRINNAIQSKVSRCLYSYVCIYIRFTMFLTILSLYCVPLYPVILCVGSLGTELYWRRLRNHIRELLAGYSAGVLGLSSRHHQCMYTICMYVACLERRMRMVYFQYIYYASISGDRFVPKGIRSAQKAEEDSSCCPVRAGYTMFLMAFSHWINDFSLECLPRLKWILILMMGRLGRSWSHHCRFHMEDFWNASMFVCMTYVGV